MKTILEATKQWLGEWNAIPQSLIQKAYPNFIDEVEILSTMAECTSCGHNEFTLNEDEEKVCTNCESVDEFSNRYDLPMWGTMWSFGTSLDDEWVKENLDIMAKLHIWVYESEELGVFIGIDGAGYDFYESHWIPLYKARGLQWHDSEVE